MKKSISIIFLICSISLSQSQIINFPDLNFKNALLTQTPTIDINNNGNIEVSEAQNTNVISVDNKGIFNMSGLSNFTNLLVLSCQNNSISSLEVSNLTNLVGIYAGGNNINSITLNNLPNLNILYCEFNNISTIDLGQLQNLQWLVCNNNFLSEINIANLSQLTHLYCWNNNISNINLNSSINLQYLLCHNNQINNLDLSNCPNLYTFYGHNNSLIDLNIKNNQLFNDNNNFSVFNNPNLQNICCDSGETSYINSYLNANFMTGIFVTDNCLLNNENNQNQVLKIYPNPITQFLFIENLTNDGIIILYNNFGKLIHIQNYVVESETKINLEFLNAGLYFVKIIDNTGFEIVEKIIKN